MAPSTQTVKLPAFLASALVNGDTSGLECRCAGGDGCGGDDGSLDTPLIHDRDCDFRWLAAALAYCAPGYIVSAEGESYFSWSCDLPGFLLGADMLDYVVLYPEGT